LSHDLRHAASPLQYKAVHIWESAPHLLTRTLAASQFPHPMPQSHGFPAVSARESNCKLDFGRAIWYPLTQS
jgi:hypothetical protein